jgi:hypothetical protein
MSGGDRIQTRWWTVAVCGTGGEEDG